MHSPRLDELVDLARRRRVARLGYKPPGAAAVTEYLVEPYRLHRAASGLLLHAWQLLVVSTGEQGEQRVGWRDFRLDRIASVADAGRAFEPRVPVTLVADAAGHAGDALPAAHGTGATTSAPGPAGAAGGTNIVGGGAAPAPTPFAAWSDRPIGELSPAEHYFQQLETAMLDGQITDEELALSQELGRRVPPQERKAVHARIFASVLHEVLQDGRVAHREELYLQQVRRFLDQLGWAP